MQPAFKSDHTLPARQGRSAAIRALRGLLALGLLAATAAPLRAQDHFIYYGHTGNIERLDAAEVFRARPRNSTTQISGITLNLTYEDIVLDNDLGFDGPDGPAAIAAFEAAFAYALAQLNHTGAVDFTVRESQTDGSGALAFAGPVFSFSPLGFQMGYVQQHILGTDPPGSMDGAATFDFGYNWHFDHMTPPASGEVDFYSVALHEITHALGFLSLTDIDGSSRINGGPATDAVRSYLDQYMETGGGTDLFDDGGMGLFLGTPSDLLGADAGVILDQVDVVSTFGRAPAIYAPSSWQSGSSLSHFSPSVPGAVMHPYIFYGSSKRTYRPVEIAALSLLGYNVALPPTPSPSTTPTPTQTPPFPTPTVSSTPTPSPTPLPLLIRYVDSAATGANNGTSWTDAYVELQSALLDAAPVTEIWVAQGVGPYLPDYDVNTGLHTRNRGTSFKLREDVDMYGGFLGTQHPTLPGGETLKCQADPRSNETVLSGDLKGDDAENFQNRGDNSLNVVRNYYNSEFDTPPVAYTGNLIFDGFTVRGGHANMGLNDSGSGIGLNFGSNIHISRCTLRDNFGTRSGAIAMGTLPPVTIRDCMFLGNRTNGAGGSGGGALHIVRDASVINCLFAGNYSGLQGGAIFTGADNLDLINCTIVNNTSVNLGGGIYMNGDNFGTQNVTNVINSVLWGNNAGGGGPTIEDKQLYFFPVSPILPDFNAHFSIIQGWTGIISGVGNFSADPMFVDPAGLDGVIGTADDNFRAQAGSPMIDAADGAMLPPGIFEDVAGLPRVADGDDDNLAALDIGAHEYGFTVLDCSGLTPLDDCDPDCNGNGLHDECDILNGTSQDCNSNGIPDECEPDCNNNGVADDCDIAAGTSLDCDGNGVPDECQPDCNGNMIPDVCDILAGTSLDCNDNAVPDECDLMSGTSQDCNTNNIPDECDIASGFSLDCNENGVPDDCDISAGTSQDCNTNGIPDECDLLGDYTDASPTLAPFHAAPFNSPQSHVLVDAPVAVGPVTFTVTADADIGGVFDEYATVRLEGSFVGDAFRSVISGDCTPETHNFTVTAAFFNARRTAGGGSPVIDLIPSPLVDDICVENSIRVTVSYIGIGAGFSEDDNLNGVPDECESLPSPTPGATGNPSATPSATPSPNPTATPSSTSTPTPTPTPCNPEPMNGGFESGDFTAWTAEDAAMPDTALQVTGPGFTSPFFTSAPTEGGFAAVHGWSASGGAPDTIRLWQEVSLIPSTTLLSFDYRAGWDTTGMTEARTFRVLVEPAGGGAPLRTFGLLNVAPDSAMADTGNRRIALGLDEFAGTPVRLVFEWTVPEAGGSAFFQLDNVQLECVSCCPGDADNSGSFVDANDFIAVQASFGADNGTGGLGDANCSGSFVDANDFIAVQANFGADCG